jgi:hypothetical protein
VLTVPGTTLLGVDLPGFPAIYQAHRKNYDAVRATRLDWSMLCPGPMIAAPYGRAHDGLRLSADTLPFPSRRWASLLPRIVHTVTFAACLKEITITYEDAAKVILDYVAPSGAFSRKRVGVARLLYYRHPRLRLHLAAARLPANLLCAKGFEQICM